MNGLYEGFEVSSLTGLAQASHASAGMPVIALAMRSVNSVDGGEGRTCGYGRKPLENDLVGEARRRVAVRLRVPSR
jgi:hypothetical protein